MGKLGNHKTVRRLESSESEQREDQKENQALRVLLAVLTVCIFILKSSKAVERLISCQRKWSYF